MGLIEKYSGSSVKRTQTTELLLRVTQQQTVQIRLEKIMNSETTPTIARGRETRPGGEDV